MLKYPHDYQRACPACGRSFRAGVFGVLHGIIYCKEFCARCSASARMCVRACVCVFCVRCSRTPWPTSAHHAKRRTCMRTRELYANNEMQRTNIHMQRANAEPECVVEHCVLSGCWLHVEMVGRPFRAAANWGRGSGASASRTALSKHQCLQCQRMLGTGCVRDLGAHNPAKECEREHPFARNLHAILRFQRARNMTTMVSHESAGALHVFAFSCTNIFGM